MLTLGIEIECFADGRESAMRRALMDHGVTLSTYGQNGWTVKYDGSIRPDRGYGHEIVSPILTLSQLREQAPAIEAALASLNGGVNSSCGLHVHLGGFEHLEMDALRNVTRRFVNFEDTLDLLQPQARRGQNNNYCKSNVGAFRHRFGLTGSPSRLEVNEAIWQRVHTATRQGLIDMFCPNHDRYFKLNLQSLLRHGTLEMRHPSASVRAADWIGLAAFYETFAMVAVNQERLWRRPTHTQETQADRFRKMVRGQSRETVTYLRQRIADNRAVGQFANLAQIAA